MSLFINDIIKITISSLPSKQLGNFVVNLFLFLGIKYKDFINIILLAFSHWFYFTGSFDYKYSLMFVDLISYIDFL